MSDYFIMMNSHKGDYIMPIVDDNGDVVLYETEEEAIEIADNHYYCKAFGYEVFERGTGIVG